MIIAHDLGTTGNKASLHSDDGRTIAHCTINYPAHFAAGGIAEQNPDDWWNAVAAATQKLLAENNISASDITGVGLSGQMMGAVLLDSEYLPVRAALIWADYRSAPQTKELLAKIPMAEAYAELGHQLNPTYSITKAMWVRDNEPENWHSSSNWRWRWTDGCRWCRNYQRERWRICLSRFLILGLDLCG